MVGVGGLESVPFIPGRRLDGVLAGFNPAFGCGGDGGGVPQPPATKGCTGRHLTVGSTLGWGPGSR
jgi:hypothetical protein